MNLIHYAMQQGIITCNDISHGFPKKKCPYEYEELHQFLSDGEITDGKCLQIFDNGCYDCWSRKAVPHET